MDLNEVIDIGNNEKYDRQSVESRKVSSKRVPVMNGMGDGTVESLDRLVYGSEPILQQPEQKVYDANEDMKRMSDISSIPGSNFEKCRIPNAIKESIRQNPLIIQPMTDSRMDELTERIGGNNDEGFNRSRDIIRKLEESDAIKNATYESPYKQTEPTGGNSKIDYELIKNIVESVVDRKFNEHRQLNENVSRNGSSLSVMKMGKKFLFLDDDDNIYECQMVYKGKNKKRKK